MLPEKRKNLMIGLIGIVILIVVIIIIASITSYIKSSNENADERDNSAYPSTYSYIGITLSDEGIYEVYGLTDEKEEYLDLRTFYEVKDAIILDDKLIIYSDAVNEVRYDSDEEEFYFYELDSFYNNSYDVKLSNDYIIMLKDNTVSFWKYGDTIDNATIISDELVSLDISVVDNTVYYLLSDGIYAYDLDTNTSTNIITLDESQEKNLLEVVDNYVYYLVDGVFYGYMMDVNERVNISSGINSDVEVIGFYDEGVLYQTTSSYTYLKKYSVKTSSNITYEYNLFYESINTLYSINEYRYYMELSDNEGNIRYVISNINTKSVVRELENSYIYLGEI